MSILFILCYNWLIKNQPIGGIEMNQIVIIMFVFLIVILLINLVLLKLFANYIVKILKNSDERTDELFNVYSKLNSLRPFPKVKDDKRQF